MLDDEHHAGVQRLVRDLNRAYRDTPALWALDSLAGRVQLDRRERRGRERAVVPAPGQRTPAAGVMACVANFSGGPHLDYRVGLPQAGRWRELVNTDASTTAAAGWATWARSRRWPEPWHGQPASAVLTVPPLGVLWLAPDD